EVDKLSSPAACPEGYAVADTYLAVREPDNRLVGMIDLRHELSGDLAEWAGHIGYSVRPSDRRRGYAKEMLRLNLLNCKQLGIDRVLVCCDEDNLPSERTILANGGVFERTTFANGKVIKRFWIEL
ncbi:MAG: GNAT family N-acetyltransferase, partial [Ruminococcaceae bacterium]|nr:GNAT family N-acetyltransferase [Oscillospiraceae bacterium]